MIDGYRLLGPDRSGPVDGPRVDVPWLLNANQVARLLGVSRSKVYELLRSGGLKSIVIGRSRRIRMSDLRAWLDEQQSA